MKNLFYLFMTSALLVVSGCVKEMPADVSDQSTDSTPTEIAMKSVTLDASSVSLNLGKSTVDDSGDFSWSSDDAIAVNVSYVDGNGQPVPSLDLMSKKYLQKIIMWRHLKVRYRRMVLLKV